MKDCGFWNPHDWTKWTIKHVTVHYEYKDQREAVQVRECLKCGFTDTRDL